MICSSCKEDKHEECDGVVGELESYADGRYTMKYEKCGCFHDQDWLKARILLYRAISELGKGNVNEVRKILIVIGRVLWPNQQPQDKKLNL